MTGLRAALGLALAGSFWILADWPSGAAATFLAAVATARLATMGHQVPLALATSLVFAFATIPAFIVVDVLLPSSSGFAMFALAIGPMLFLCALLMANEKTFVIGYMSALLFASAGAFQNRMAYDAVALVNTSIAAVFSAALAMVLWATLAPQSPLAMRRRFVRAARKALVPTIAAARPSTLSDFESAMGGALVQLHAGLAPARPDDATILEAGITLLGAGAELILHRADRTPLPPWTAHPVHSCAHESERPALSRLKNGVQAAISRCLAQLGRDPLDRAAVLAAVREIRARQDQLALRTTFAIHAKQCDDPARAA